jgi:murein DD-endopeptidase MepM/ murein hydrolase activator NlpD
VIALAWEGDWPLSQLFGERPWYYATYGYPGHNGIDVACPVGTPLRAIVDGLVVETGHDPRGYGRYFKLRQAGGCEWLYAHLQEGSQPAQDSWLQASQPCGLSGDTGRVDGAHLHLGMRADWRYRGSPYQGWVDPLPFLGLT